MFIIFLFVVLAFGIAPLTATVKVERIKEKHRAEEISTFRYFVTSITVLVGIIFLGATPLFVMAAQS